MSTTSRRSLLSVAPANTDPAYLNHKINQLEIQIRALDQQLFDSNQARAELEARLAESDDYTETRSSCIYDADEIFAQEDFSSLQAEYNERVEENRSMLQDIETFEGYIKILHQKVRPGRCKVYWQELIDVPRIKGRVLSQKTFIGRKSDM